MSLPEALDQLRAALAQHAVAPLSHDYYLEAHNRFERASTQQDQLRNVLRAEIEGLAARLGRPVSLLSAGCGGGQLDIGLIDALGATLAGYTGIDINASELARFETLLAGRDHARLAEADILTFETDERFDAVVSIHVVYYLEDKARYLDRLRALTALGGVTIIAVAPFSPMNEIASVFWARQGVKEFFAEDFQRLLAASGLQARRTRIEAAIPLSLYLGEGADQAVIDFTVQAAASTFAPHIRSALNAAFDAAAQSVDGVRALAHPVDLFVLRSGDTTPRARD